MLDKQEFDRWIRGAVKTLESAKRDFIARDYSWACFKAHQAAEKALEAILWGIGNPQYGHVLKKLVEKLSELGLKIERMIIDDCIELSKYYVTTRYPDVWGEGLPEEFFTEREAKNAILKAKRIVDWVNKKWRELLEKGRERG